MIQSSWHIQQALLSGHAGPRLQSNTVNLPTFDDVTERCPHCQKLARYETYQSQRDGQLYHVELIRCSHKDCKRTTKTETMIGDTTMPKIPQEIRDRYKILRERLGLTDVICAQRMGLPSRNCLSSMLCHGQASTERQKAFSDLVDWMESEATRTPKPDAEPEPKTRPEPKYFSPPDSEEGGPGDGPIHVEPEPEPKPEAHLINEAVAIIKRIPMQFRELLLDLVRHEEAADQARIVLERNLHA